MKNKKNNTLTAIIILALTRLVLNMTRRFAYPFVPAISRELNTSLMSVQNVVALQGAMGLTGPFLSGFSEKYGRKKFMIGAILVAVMAAAVMAIFPYLTVFYVGMLAFALAKYNFDPAVHAYISDRIPYHRRASAMGITELAWAAALIISAPIVGFLLKNSGLSAVFLFLLISGIAVLLLLIIFIPDDLQEMKARNGHITITPWLAWRELRTSPAAMAGVIYSLLLAAANDSFLIVYGTWMENTFQVVLTTLGILTAVVASAEVTGEFTVIGLADKFGKRRFVLVSTLISSVLYLLLPLTQSSLPLALLVIFILFYFVEMSIVASIPLFSEVLPNARGVMLGSIVAGSAAGRFLGAFMGSVIYRVGNFELTAIVAFLVGMMSYVIFWYFVPEPESELEFELPD